MKKLYEGTLVRQIKSELAKELHDELGSALAVISSRIKIAKHKLACKDDLPPEFFNKAETLVDSMLGSARDFIWIVASSEEDPVNLFYYLKDLGENLFDGKDLKFTAHLINNATCNLKLDVGQSYQIVLMFKEALTNVARHSKCSNVKLRLLISDKKLVFILKDDGTGFRSGINGFKVTNSYGIGNMHDRADKIGGKLNISSKPGHGTSVRFEMSELTPAEPQESIFIPRRAS